jgi:error-prone DNA polymerase
VVWPSLFERQRRVLMTASMMAINGRIQREGEVVHLVAYTLFDLSDLLAGVGGRDAPLKLRQGRGDEFAHGWSPDARDAPPKGMTARDIYIPDLHIDAIRPKTRDFR